jgi:hypothetical protein
VKCALSTLALASLCGACAGWDSDMLAQSPWSGLDDDTKAAVEVGCQNAGPGYSAQAEAAKGGACAPATGDGPCATCAKAACCAASLACWADVGCACLVPCRAAGDTLATCSTSSGCGAADAVYDAEASCIAAHCSGKCPTLATP